MCKKVAEIMPKLYTFTYNKHAGICLAFGEAEIRLSRESLATTEEYVYPSHIQVWRVK